MTDIKREKIEFAPREVAHAVTPADVAKAREARIAALKAAAAENVDEGETTD